MTDVPDPTSPPAARGPGNGAFWRSPGWRFAILCLLTLGMCVPLLMVSFVIEDRVSYQRAALSDVAQQWGGPVMLKGPVMVIPVEITRDRVVEDEDGNRRTDTYTELSNPILLMPEGLQMRTHATSEVRRRGIFEVPVYAADLSLGFAFDPDRVPQVIGPRETVLWDEAVVTIAMPATRSFSGAAVLTVGGDEVDLEPGSPVGHGGIQARVGDPRGLGRFGLEMGLNGADKLFFAPTGRLTELTMTSDWPHPSFSGRFLPKTRDVRADGFQAQWEIPHLARDIAQVARGYGFEDAWFGVRFYNPVDIYQRVQRAAKYGILFIALTFLTVFLTERLSARPAHPAQIILIGIAQCVFFLLLLSFAEQIGFGPAYLAASAATIGLLSFYGKTGLALGRWWWTLGAVLVVLYGVLYLILRSTDYALLAGSLLTFAAVAVLMVLTRRDDWSGGLRRSPAPT